jgi:PST family polysaccharide transporter
MRGGAYLSLRSVLGTVLGLLGVFFLTRAIGPANFGLYNAVLGIFTFVQFAALQGISTYLLRLEEERDEIYHQAFTLLVILTAGTLALILAGLPILEEWVRLEGFEPVALAMFLALPVIALARIPTARLERALDYKQVAKSEFAGNLGFYLIALPLAYRGYGVWACVVGWWVQQVVTLAMVYRAAPYGPRLYWDRKLAGRVLRYGFSFSASSLVFQTRDLIYPLVVGRYLGADALGYVALALRLVKRLTIVKEIAYRLSVPALARVQRDRTRMIRAVTEGMQLQVLAQAPLLVGFGWFGLWFLPFAFGPEWRPAMEVYPFIALSYLANSIFNMLSSGLYALGRNLRVVAFSATYVALLFGSAFLLVPRFGLLGYGLAEVVALASYAVIHYNFSRVVGSPAYRLTAIWGVAAGLALFVQQLGPWVLLGPLIVLLWPPTWRELGGYARLVWSMRRAREA